MTDTEVYLTRPAVGPLARSAFLITALYVLNLGAGFGLQVLLAASFGAGFEMDCYFAASAIPLLAKATFSGALSVVFVPVFIEQDKLHGKEHAWSLASNLINVSGLALTTVTLISIGFAPGIVHAVAPGFEPGQESFLLAVRLLRILLPTVLLNGLASLMMAVYFAEGRFALPAVVPLVNTVIMLVFVLVLSKPWGVASVALGALVGAVGQCAVLVPSLLRRSRYKLSLQPLDAGVRQTVRLMVPWILGAILYKANPVIDRFVASLLPQGSISYLGYALQIVVVATTLVSQGIVTVLFPGLSRSASDGALLDLMAKAYGGMRLILMIVMPLMIILVVLDEQVVALLFQRGEFSGEATVGTASALRGYAVAVVVTSMGGVLSRVYYAMQDTLTVAKVGGLGAVLNFALALVLAPHLKVFGPALAYSLASTMNFVVLLVLLHKRLNLSIPRDQLLGAARIVAASAIAALGVGLSMGFFSSSGDLAGLRLAAFLTAMGAVCLLAYVLALRLFGVREVTLLASWLHRKDLGTRRGG